MATATARRPLNVLQFTVLTFAALLAIFASAIHAQAGQHPIIYPPTEVGQRVDCFTWGKVVQVLLDSEQRNGTNIPVLHIWLRDWNQEKGQFEYFGARATDRPGTPLGQLQLQANTAMASNNLAMQFVTRGACGTFVYEPQDPNVYDITPVDDEGGKG